MLMPDVRSLLSSKGKDVAPSLLRGLSESAAHPAEGTPRSSTINGLVLLALLPPLLEEAQARPEELGAALADALLPLARALPPGPEGRYRLLPLLPLRHLPESQGPQAHLRGGRERERGRRRRRERGTERGLLYRAGPGGCGTFWRGSCWSWWHACGRALPLLGLMGGTTGDWRELQLLLLLLLVGRRATGDRKGARLLAAAGRMRRRLRWAL